MKGGYISCNGNTWHPTNPGIYNVKEANGLNYLGICFDGNGTNRYNLNGPRKWYFRNNKTNLDKLLYFLRNFTKHFVSYNFIIKGLEIYLN